MTMHQIDGDSQKQPSICMINTRDSVSYLKPLNMRRLLSQGTDHRISRGLFISRVWGSGSQGVEAADPMLSLP